MKKAVLDTNIILRLVDKKSSEHKNVLGLVKSLISDRYHICLLPQTLIEFWVVATRPVDANGFGWNTEFTRQELDKLLGLFILLPDVDSIFTHWLNLVSKGVSGKRAHDARIAAALLAHEADAIVTFNSQDFKDFGVEVISVHS